MLDAFSAGMTTEMAIASRLVMVLVIGFGRCCQGLFPTVRFDATTNQSRSSRQAVRRIR